MKVELSDSRKHGEGLANAYISYAVTFERQDGTTITTRKRYGDFETLHSYLLKEYPACVIPPLPPKKRMGYLDRFGDRFTHKRMKSLERFLMRLLAHPALSKDRGLALFLSTAEDHYVAPETTLRMDGEGVFESVTDSLINAFSKLKERDERFDSLADNVQAYGDNLNALERNGLKLVKSNQDIGALFGLLAFEFENSDSIKQLMGDVGGFAEWVQFLNRLSKSYGKLGVDEEDQLVGCVTDQIGYCASMKDTLKLRDQKQIEYESMSDYLEQVRAERARLLNPALGGSTSITSFVKEKYTELKGGNADQVRQDRIKRLEQKTVELEKAIENSKTISHAFSDGVIEEIKHFDQLKTEELKSMLIQTTHSHIEFLSASLEGLDDVIAKLEQSR